MRRRGAGAHRAESLILRRPACRIFVAGCLRAPSRQRRRRDTGRMEARASEVFVGRARELEELETRARRDAGRERRDRPRRRRSGHRQDPARVRARERAPATRGSRSCSGARSISSARSCRTSRSSRPCVRSDALRQVDGPTAGSQLRVFEETLALLTERAAAAPVLLVLEDLHWADTSTLDLVVFLAHNLDDRRVLLLATYRADEPRVGRAHAPTRRRRPALGLGARRSSSDRSTHEELAALLAARADAPLPACADGRDRRPLRGQPLLRRGAPRRRRRRAQRAPARPARPAAAARGPARPIRRRACCAWPRPPDATSGTRCSARWRRCPSATCASRCARRSSTASSSPSRRPAASASATRCWPRRSTRRSCPASARSCTRGSPTSSRAARARRRRSSRRTGRRRVALRRRWPRRSRRRARRRPSSAWRRRSRTSSGRSRCGPPCRTRPSSPGSTSPSSARWAAELASQDGRGAARGRARRGERSSSSAPRTRTARRSCTCASVSTSTRPAAATPASPRSSARSSSCRRSRPRRSARMRWRRSRAG